MLPQKIFATQLKEGQIIDTIFLALQKSMPTGKTGRAYLNLKLGDRTGEVDAKVWDRVEFLSERFNAGDFVRVQAKAQVYQDKIQLNITEIEAIAHAGIDIGDFLPVTKFNIEEMYAELITLIGTQVTDKWVQKMLLTILEDPEIARKYKKAPAAKGMHHAFIGGLLEHELGLARLAIDVCKHYPHINLSHVIAGCLLHDIGKIDELTYERGFEYSDEGKLIGHLVMGIELIGKTAANIPGFPRETELLLKHLVASHHGQLDYGSPVVPLTLEAIMVHYLDDMDSKLQAMNALIEKEAAVPSNWTTFHRLFGRTMYKPLRLQYEKEKK